MSVFEYLVTSRVRRLLLLLLWRENMRGSAVELAEQAGVALAGAQAELKEMQRFGLAVSERIGKKEVFAANPLFDDAGVIQALVATVPPRVTVTETARPDIERRLKSLGAPLRDVEAMPIEPFTTVETLLAGAGYARRSPTVARTLPVCAWKSRTALDAKTLAALHGRAEDKHALAFFIELAGDIGGDRRLVGLAEVLRDERLKAIRPFFFAGARRTSSATAFPLARKWGFEMNMDRESFRSLFAKFVRDS